MFTTFNIFRCRLEVEKLKMDRTERRTKRVSVSASKHSIDYTGSLERHCSVMLVIILTFYQNLKFNISSNSLNYIAFVWSYN